MSEAYIIRTTGRNNEAFAIVVFAKGRYFTHSIFETEERAKELLECFPELKKPNTLCIISRCIRFRSMRPLMLCLKAWGLRSKSNSRSNRTTIPVGFGHVISN